MISLSMTRGRVQDTSPCAHLYVVPGISTPRSDWVEETEGTKLKMARSPRGDEAQFGEVAHTPSTAEDGGLDRLDSLLPSAFEANIF